MNEKENLIENGEQPVPKITDNDLDILIAREFPGDIDTVKVKLKKINSETQQGKNRISASVLKLANRNLKKLII